MSTRMLSLAAFTALTVLISCSQKDQGPWKPLFNGTDFTEFEQLGGKALYRVEKGTIVGTAVANTENSFLCTRMPYDDFILEYKVLVDTSMNSGVQIRSHAYMNGRVHGYQVEIDPAPRAYSGGIYDEARRAWIFDLSGNEAGRAAFRNQEWNQFRVEAIGNSIKTWVNGVMCANLIDEADGSGFIGFQVHSVDMKRKPWAEGAEVRWKDIRIMTGGLEQYRFQGTDPVPAREVLLTNRLTEKEKAEGWELLFDGLTMDKWRGACKDSFPRSGWAVVDGILEIQAEEGEAEAHRGGDIITLDHYSDFELSVDFMLSPGANSGIKYFVTEREPATGATVGLEYQLLDDDLNEDSDKGVNGNHKLASLYEMIPPGEVYARAPGEWNTAKIVSKGKTVQHWLNDHKVLEYTRGSREYRDLVGKSKYRIYKNFGEAESGPVLLQEHGSNVSFKNIKIKPL